MTLDARRRGGMENQESGGARAFNVTIAGLSPPVSRRDEIIGQGAVGDVVRRAAVIRCRSKWNAGRTAGISAEYAVICHRLAFPSACSPIDPFSKLFGSYLPFSAEVVPMQNRQPSQADEPKMAAPSTPLRVRRGISRGRSGPSPKQAGINQVGWGSTV